MAPVLVIALGAALRVVDWLGARSLWIDEATLALNIAGRPYLRLLPPLEHNQSAPLIFLWLERTAVKLFGVNELALRLVPLIAGIASLGLIYTVACRLFGARVALLAAVMAAISPALIRYSNEAKQYGCEGLVVLVIIWLALRWLEATASEARGGAFLLAGVVSMWFGASTPFILAGALGILTLEAVRRRSVQRVFVAAILAWGLSFVVAYSLIYGSALRDPYMSRYWSAAFLTPGRPGWLVEAAWSLEAVLWGALVGRDTIREPAGVAWVLVIGLSVALSLFLGLGARRLLREKGMPGSTLLLVPGLFVLLASSARLYPISLRTMMFFLPILLLLAAAGLEAWVYARPGQARFRQCGAAVLILLPGYFAIFEVVNLNPREDLRPLIEELRARRERGEPVYVFAGSIPAWTFYTTDWSAPDSIRLEFLNAIARPGGPAFHNMPSRRRVTPDEGRGLRYDAWGGLELYGIPTGMEMHVNGLVDSVPDADWTTTEAERIKAAANPGVWVLLSHFYGPEGVLLQRLEARGGRVTYSSTGNSSALIHYEFSPQ